VNEMIRGSALGASAGFEAELMICMHFA